MPAGIQAFSHYPNESEVLFPPYTKFRVVHRKQQGHTLFLTLETVEFPSLHLLIEKGDWNGVKEILSSQAQAAEKTGEQPWMVQQASAGHQIRQMAQKIVVEGAGSPGLQAFSQLLGMGAEPASAVDTLHAGGLGHVTPGIWRFDAGRRNTDDKRDSASCIHAQGTWWQRYAPQHALILEQMLRCRKKAVFESRWLACAACF